MLTSTPTTRDNTVTRIYDGRMVLSQCGDLPFIRLSKVDEVITSTAHKRLPDFAHTVRFLSANSFDIRQLTARRGKYNASEQGAVQKQSTASTVSAFLM